MGSERTDRKVVVADGVVSDNIRPISLELSYVSLVLAGKEEKVVSMFP